MPNKKITNICRTFYSISLFCAIIATSNCQSTGKTNSNSIPFNESEYDDVIENYTMQAQEYDGLQNVLEFQATFLNSKVIEAQTRRKAHVFQLEKSQFENELASRVAGSKYSTEFFISFYTPERKNNDLIRNDSLWKIFLVSKGKRYSGKVEKITLLNSEIQSLYPNHNRWSNPYIVKFPVAVSEIEHNELELIITGPVGKQSVYFNPITK